MPVPLFAALRAVHVLSGALWVGAAVMSAAYIVPAVMASGPAGGQVMRVMAQVRRLPVFMNMIMLTTLVTGLALYGLDSGGFQWAWIASRTGIAFTLGALLAFVTAGIGQVVSVPSVKRLGALGAAVAASGGPPTPEQAAEMGAIQRKLLGATRVAAALVVLAVLVMATARFA